VVVYIHLGLAQALKRVLARVATMATVNSVRGREWFDLSIMYSRECNLFCSHCMYNSGPGVRDRLDLVALGRFISTWDERINSVGFYGGEVTLHLSEYKRICDLLSQEIQRWMFSNGTWSTNLSRAHEVLQWTFDNRVSPLIVSGTKYHTPHQDRTVLESLARSLPEHVWLKGDEEHYLAMGRLAGLPFTCTHRCETDKRPTRIAVRPDGSIIFQTCNGVYPVIGNIDEGFPELARRCQNPVCQYRKTGDQA